MILVPMDAPGVKRACAQRAGVRLRRRAARPLGGRLRRTCACRSSNLLLGEGRGFEIAQGRLGPGPHPPLHAPDRRWPSARSRLMCQRALGARRVRQAARRAGRVARAHRRCAHARSTRRASWCCNAAWKMDVAGNKAAQKEIAMIKVVAPNMACEVIDQAIQAVRRRRRVATTSALGWLYAHVAHAAHRRRPRRGAPQPHREARARPLPARAEDAPCSCRARWCSSPAPGAASAAPLCREVDAPRRGGHRGGRPRRRRSPRRRPRNSAGSGCSATSPMPRAVESHGARGRGALRSHRRAGVERRFRRAGARPRRCARRRRTATWQRMWDVHVMAHARACRARAAGHAGARLGLPRQRRLGRAAC
ncbi:MAG: hypothetical protein MZW92_09695 [Comamonadaceae bacterium]|nr:hypothetical protein [Comamonadaceae bacterium]